MERTIKRCIRCKEVQPIDQFVRNGTSRTTGRQMYHSYCRPCWQDYKKEHRVPPSKKVEGTGVKQCRDCAVVLTADNWVQCGVSHYTGIPKYQNRCRSCWRAYGKAWRQRNPDNVWLTAKKAALSYYFNLSIDDYFQRLADQKHVCAACNEPETVQDAKTGKVRMLAVDHCHKTKRIRGLLCSRCNRSIGLLNERPELARAIAEYIEHA